MTASLPGVWINESVIIAICLLGVDSRVNHSRSN